MDVEVIRDEAGLRDLGDQWDRLEQAVAAAGQAPGGTYYLKHHFVTAWWASYRDEPGVELAVLALRQNGDLVGIAPLATTPAKRGDRRVRRLRFATHGDYLGFLLDPEAPQETVAKNLLEAMHADLTWDTARLGGIPVDTPLGKHLLRSDDYNAQFTQQVENPFINLTRDADFAAFSARAIPKHTRKQRRRLAREHPDVTLALFRGNEQDIFARIGEIHRAERDYLIHAKGRTERHSLFDDRARWGHYRQIFTGTDDALTFGLEAPDGTLAGYRTTFQDGRRLLSWNGAYHPDFADFRIGTMLLHDMVEHLYEGREIDQLDLGAGRYAWKFGWTDDFRSTYELRLERDELTVATPQQRGPVTLEDQTLAHPGAAVAGPTSAITTYVVSPHPDDEVLRTTGHLTSGADHGRCVLVAVSDGGRSPLARRRGWTPEQERSTRRAEQAAAWAALTEGRGEIIRLGLPDGALTAEAVTQAIARTVPGLLDPGARVLVAAHGDDYHADHRAVVRALRELAPDDLLLSLSNLMDDPADERDLIAVARPADERRGAALVARDAYGTIGRRSVPEEFDALVKRGYRSRLTAPDQPGRRVTGAHGSVRPRILVLGRRRDALPGVDGPRELTGVEEVRWAAGVARGQAPDATDLRVDPITVDRRAGRVRPVSTTGNGIVQHVAARVRAAARATAQRVRPDRPDQPAPPSAEEWSGTLTRSTRARLLIADADVMLSADPATDVALAERIDLAQGAHVVPSARSAEVFAALRDLDELVGELTDEQALTTGTADGADHSAARLQDWTPRAERIGHALVHDRHLLTGWSDVWTRLPRGVDRTRVRTQVLGALPWDPQGPGAALRDALRLAADLTLEEALARDGLPDLAERVPEVADRTLVGAATAMRARRNQDALEHLTAALAVLFHPALHRDLARSPLVADPAGFLRGLWVAPAYRTLVDRDKVLSVWGARRQLPDPSRHIGVADSRQMLVLGEADEAARTVDLTDGEANTHDLARWLPDLGGVARAGDALGETALRDLAGLIGAQHQSARFGQSALPEARRSGVWELAARLVETDQVLVPRADAATTWVSHLCPPEVRVVVRVRSEDLVGPWVQLIRWDRVDHVVVDDDSSAALLAQILDGLGSDLTVTVGPLPLGAVSG